MTKIIIILFFCISGVCFAQRNYTLELKVLGIKELNDCYILSAINADSLSSDTLYLVSVKDSLKKSIKYEKISVGKTFYFTIRKKRETLSVPDKNFRLRVKNTVVWRGDEDSKKYPLMIENTKGLYIVKSEVK